MTQKLNTRSLLFTFLAVFCLLQPVCAETGRTSLKNYVISYTCSFYDAFKPEINHTDERWVPDIGNCCDYVLGKDFEEGYAFAYNQETKICYVYPHVAFNWVVDLTYKGGKRNIDGTR